MPEESPFSTILSRFAGENEPLVPKNSSPRRPLRQYQSIESRDQLTVDQIVNNVHGRLVRTGSVIVAETGERINRDNDRNPLDLENQTSFATTTELPYRSYRYLNKQYNRFAKWMLDNNYHHVVKCSLAYLLASLAVYNPLFSSWLGKSDSKHVIATVAVYFHPSRTLGSMHQSLMFAIGAIIYGFMISLVSTGISSWFYSEGYELVSILINLVFVSIGLGIVAYMKQQMNHPTFNVACSLASISIVSAIVKEGPQYPDNIPFERLLSLFKIVCTGSAISVLVCYSVIPSSAVDLLKKELNKSCSLMSKYLIQIEKCFISGNNINADELISNLNAELKKNSTQLNKLLDEAKYELHLVGKEDQYYVLSKLVRSTQFMSMELGGLKGSAEMQWSTLHDNDSLPDAASTATLHTIESQEHGLSTSCNASNLSDLVEDGSNIVALNSKQLFDLFIYYLGPSMRSFCYTIRGVLNGLPFKEDSESPSYISNYQRSLERANDMFKRKYNKSIERLYRQDIFKQEVDLPVEIKIDEEEVAASCGNFASILSEFSKELNLFINELGEYSTLASTNRRSWQWLRFWKSLNPAQRSKSSLDAAPDLNYAIQKFNNTLQNRTSTTDSRDTIKFKLWEFFSFFRKVEVQFSIRVGLGAFFLSSLAFLPFTKSYFNKWRGEWALVTYSIIMNKSLGGTTMTVNWRFLGTFLGCFIAYFSWSMSDGEAFVLCTVGWIISLLSFNIILNWKENNAYGRFILLTYNITALYSYNITRSSEDLEPGDDTDPIILDLAIHRFLSIAIGVIWALVMTVSFLPMTARGRLKKGLSILWLRLGIIWNTDPLEVKDDRLVGLADSIGISSIMRELELLLKQAGKELRLKGKFRADLYGKLIKSTEKIIESFQNINTMILIDPNLSEMELEVLNYTKQERGEFTNRIFLIFYMISSCLTLGIPIPSKPASIEHSKDRILVKLNEIRREKLLNDEDYVLLYSYVLVCNSITNELNKILKYLGDLYGLVDEETFEI